MSSQKRKSTEAPSTGKKAKHVNYAESTKEDEQRKRKAAPTPHPKKMPQSKIEAKASTGKAKTPAKDDDDSDDDDSDDDDSEDDEPAPKKAAVTKPAAASSAKGKAPVKKDDDDDDDSDDDDSEDDEPAPKKAAVAKPAAAASSAKGKAPVKKDDDSDDDDSDDDDSEDDEPAPKKAVDTSAAKDKNAKKRGQESRDAPNDNTTSSSTQSTGKEHKIYVKGLPWLTTEEEVKEFFKSCGPLVSVDLPVGADGRSTGTAFIVFANRAGVDAALELDGQTWPGTERWLKIQEGLEKPGKSYGSGGVRPEGCNTVFVGNLPWDVEESQIREIFGQCGEIARIRFSMTEEGEFRGFGHVEFTDGEATDAAVKLAGTDVNGRAIRVDYAPPRERNSLGAGGRGGRGGRDGGRGGRGGRDGGRGRGRGTPGVINKNKGTIAVGAPTGKKMTFDD